MNVRMNEIDEKLEN